MPNNNEQSYIPTHIAVIMDGNGRWAKQRGLSRSEGHKAGANSAREIIKECSKIGIKHLTLYTFSTENWKRPKEEINFIFEMLVSFLKKELPTLEQYNIKLNVLGNIKKLPLATRKALEFAMNRTSSNTHMVLNLALNYSGQEEIIEACKTCLKSGIDPNELNLDKFKLFLYTKDQPDPDLIIRTSGELRLSNFLPFQSAYSELYFTDVLWPDFTPSHLHIALNSFIKRNRRFGGI